MAQGIRHEHRGEIALMHGLDGLAAVQAALGDLVLPAGRAAPEQAAGQRLGHSRSNPGS
ncbi:hypothetical protein [Methylobacterium sp. PvR107]|uniref:hypothetical protein n=1 Tax=Methylobacterium sp. PvR107 TaxID=2806597 RepID=UPI001AE94E15|nr:hypothetical protein [Methylobacterium sp. PvR107]MBP1180530.1 hypothetical protein [Methylobacterium sp. PvR107]